MPRDDARHDNPDDVGAAKLLSGIAAQLFQGCDTQEGARCIGTEFKDVAKLRSSALYTQYNLHQRCAEMQGCVSLGGFPHEAQRSW